MTTRRLIAIPATIAGAVLLCVLAPAMLDFLIRQMLYPAPPFRVPSPPPSPLEEVALAFDSGDVAVGWAYEHPAADRSTPAVVFFHGNGENLETLRQAGLYEDLGALGIHFLAVDYPGYGRSSGKPTEAGLVASAEAGFEWIAERYPDQPKVLLGWSLGAAVAIQAAAHHGDRVDRLVLLSAWDDLEALAAVHYPPWLVGLGLDETYDSLAVASEIRVPVLQIHGTNDHIIPIAHGRKLYEALAAAAPAVRFVAVPNTGHNDLLSRPVVWRELAAFLRPP
ncbi:MAG: alpha/beta hydrolase [bacterium]|nr:alpha/beta hydrolase [bacterium]